MFKMSIGLLLCVLLVLTSWWLRWNRDDGSGDKVDGVAAGVSSTGPFAAWDRCCATMCNMRLASCSPSFEDWYLYWGCRPGFVALDDEDPQQLQPLAAAAAAVDADRGANRPDRDRDQRRRRGSVRIVPDDAKYIREQARLFLHDASLVDRELVPSLDAAVGHYYSFQWRNHPMFRSRKEKAKLRPFKPLASGLKHVIASEFTSLGRPQSSPVLYLIGGGGGSGKSTLVNTLFQKGLLPAAGPVEGIVYVNHDILMERDKRYVRLVRHKNYGAAGLSHPDAAAIGDLICTQALELRSHLILEGTLSRAPATLDLIARARARGYAVHLFGVTTPIATAIQRVLRRAAATSRFVPPPLMLGHHRAFAQAWPEFVAAADLSQLYSSRGLRVVRSAGATAGSDAKLIFDCGAVLDHGLYAEFAAAQLIRTESDNVLDVYDRYLAQTAKPGKLRNRSASWWGDAPALRKTAKRLQLEAREQLQCYQE